MTKVTVFSGMREKRTSLASDPTSRSGASVSNQRPSSRSSRLPASTLSRIRSIIDRVGHSAQQTRPEEGDHKCENNERREEQRHQNRFPFEHDRSVPYTDDVVEGVALDGGLARV